MSWKILDCKLIMVGKWKVFGIGSVLLEVVGHRLCICNTGKTTPRCNEINRFKVSSLSEGFEAEYNSPYFKSCNKRVDELGGLNVFCYPTHFNSGNVFGCFTYHNNICPVHTGRIFAWSKCTVWKKTIEVKFIKVGTRMLSPHLIWRCWNTSSKSTTWGISVCNAINCFIPFTRLASTATVTLYLLLKISGSSPISAAVLSVGGYNKTFGLRL